MIDAIAIIASIISAVTALTTSLRAYGKSRELARYFHRVNVTTGCRTDHSGPALPPPPKNDLPIHLLSTVIWAGYWLLNLRDGRDPVQRLLVNFLFGTLFAFGYAAAAGDVGLPTLPGMVGAAYVGTFEMGLTFVLWISALKLSRTTAEVSGLIFLAPFLSLLVIWLVLGERIHPSTVVGLALIVGGIVALQRATAGSKPAGQADDGTV